MKILVIVAPLASAWIQPGGLLEFCREMEPRLREERKEEFQETTVREQLPQLGSITAMLPDDRDS